MKWLALASTIGSSRANNKTTLRMEEKKMDGRWSRRVVGVGGGVSSSSCCVVASAQQHSSNNSSC